MKTIKLMFGELRQFSLLWSTQSLSALGTSMTAFALVIWSYKQEGSALVTALLSVCSYAPYVAMSIFAGALSDRWDKKRTMLACDFSQRCVRWGYSRCFCPEICAYGIFTCLTL